VSRLEASSTAPDSVVETSPRDNKFNESERRYRHLVWSFAKRDLKSRYKGTVLGWLWSVLVPLARLTVYALVFSVIFRAVPPDFGNGREGIFVVWFFPGLAVFTFFSAAISGGMTSLIGAGGILSRIYLPSYVPTLGVVAGNAVQSAIELGVALLIVLAFLNIGWSWLVLPLWIVLLFVFSASLGYVLAVANVFARDVSQIVGVALQLLFFTSAVIFPPSAIPERLGPIPLRDLIMLNPLAQIVQSVREATYELVFPGLIQTVYVGGWTLAVFLLAVLIYRRSGQDVAEVL
jgi:ABC-type polysaccharide/polyol phosphate export permease